MGVIDHGGQAALRAPGINAGDLETKEFDCIVCDAVITLDGEYEFTRGDEDGDRGDFLIADEQSGDVKYCDFPDGWAHAACVCRQCGAIGTFVHATLGTREPLCTGCHVIAVAPTTASLESAIGKVAEDIAVRDALQRHITDLEGLLKAIGGTP